jgi:energy-coupling factor transporter transmembrane protein EcfT
MSWALEARGFQAQKQRTYFLQIRMAPRDWLALTLAALGLGGFIALHLIGRDQIPGLVLR